MDSDLDKFFQQSKPACIPQVEIKALPTLEELSKLDANGNPKKPSRREQARAKIEPEDRLKRTLFIGNLPVEVCKSKTMQRSLKKKFSVYGKLVSIRFRSIGFSRAMPRKLAYATQQFHEERTSVNAYIVMEREEDAREAVKENSTSFEGHHIRVDVAAADRKNDTKKSIFIGNLPLNVNEEAVWDFFGTCGQITNVRLIRDKKTNLGKGFGYVSFADKSCIDLALQLSGTDCAGRPIRISKCQKEGFHKETKVFKEKKRLEKEKLSGTSDDHKAMPTKPFERKERPNFITPRANAPTNPKIAMPPKGAPRSAMPPKGSFRSTVPQKGAFRISKPSDTNRRNVATKKY